MPDRSKLFDDGIVWLYKKSMSKDKIKQLIESRIQTDGVVETGVAGVQLFRVSEPVQCSPGIYEPSVAAIVSGTKEFFFDGKTYEYDADQYLCCSVTMPLQAGTPAATPDNPLLGVYITLDARIMTELAIEIESAAGISRSAKGVSEPRGITLARWSDSFTDALLRLLQLGDNPAATRALGAGRLKEVYYAILEGDAGESARQAFGVGNGMAKAIEYMSSHLDRTITIDEMASRAGMSKTVFHRKFKEATAMSPIQYAKLVRLNSAAMKIAGGMNVNEAAMQVGYSSSSQFSREFKRQYGESPRRWSVSHQ